MRDRAQAFIEIAALQHNLSVVRSIAPSSKILAMVKGNAYGHGLVATGKILANVDGLGVACLDEAIKLREGEINTPIVLMSGVFSREDLRLVDLYNLQMVVHDPFQVKLLQSNSINQPLSIWLKMDTGMHRLGFSPSSFKAAYETIVNHVKIKQPINLMTHLASADDIHCDATLAQLETFSRETHSLNNCSKSIANSAGLMAWPDSVADWNRPGIMLYGISPMLDREGSDYGLQAAMTLKSKIVALHDLRQGDAVGYGGTFICPEEMRVATVAIGYGDGYPRHASGGCPVLIREKYCPLIGRVSMDLITIDVRSCPQAAIGDTVILWGNGLPVETVAKYASTIPYELLCNVARRVAFIYK